MCIKNTEKSFIKLQKQRIKFFFFLVVSNLTYGKNISDNEHQLIFSIRYSVFGIRIVESEQYYSYSVFGLFSKNELFGIRYSLNFQKRIYSVFGIWSIFTIRCNSALMLLSQLKMFMKILSSVKRKIYALTLNRTVSFLHEN